ncbi:transcription-repair coupling factor [Helicobacter sp. 23-1045]
MLNSNFYKILQSKFDFKIAIFKDYGEALEAREVCKFCKIKDSNFPNAYLLNDFCAKKGDDLRSYAFELGELLLNLARFYNDKNGILLAPIHSLLHPLPPPKWLQSISLQKAQKCDFEKLKETLLNFGFENMDLVYAPKEMAIHGDIIDIFPQNAPHPLRISFFDDEIEDIASFDAETQKIIERIESAEIFPALFSLDSGEYADLERLAVESPFDAFTKDIHSLGFWFIRQKPLTAQYKSIISPTALNEIAELEGLRSLNYIDFSAFKALDLIALNPSFSDISARGADIINKILPLHKDKKITILSQNELILDSLQIPQNAQKNTIILRESIALNIITPNEIILSLNALPKKRAKKPTTIRLNELNAGDYIVHSEYGIGRFSGITQTRVLGNISDFIEIIYLGDDKLLLPVHNLNLIDKYIANTASVPTLDKLGKGSFAKIKEKIRPKLLQIAQEIIDIAAARELIKGKIIDKDNVELAIFKQSAGFELTADQDKSIDEILRDLGSGRVMDRLLVGDVGFGKTEVAMNAIFACAKSGFQSALIVPTTLLSNQHFKTLSARFAPHGLKIAKLDRFATKKSAILDSLKNGSVDIVVGTHSLLNAEFKNLALIVLDEEHKFGVKQKEKLKNLTKDVHILSMSATPIPRTLNLALSKIKTQSHLNIPPDSRIAPKTFVKNYSDEVLRDAILRELKRNGQIFYIHNNIASMEQRKREILKLMPNLKIAILHSKIPQTQSEDIMIDFANGAFNVLLSTSIVESGIHLPNANTIIVDSADCFGMADLHQLRGRIGRGDKEGYCYFFVDSKENITAEARKRLISLESNSFLGAGGILSYNDLEIRGGGNILGEAQSGHIENIGYSLYLKMLEDSINFLSGKGDLAIQKGVDLKLNISAFLNAELINSDRIRLDLYRRLSNASAKSEIYEIEGEIAERFGKIDSYTRRFLQLMLVKILANARGLKAITNYNENITLTLENGEKVSLKAEERDDENIMEAILAYLR